MGNCCPQKDDTISFSSTFPSIISLNEIDQNEKIDFDEIIADYHRRHPKPDHVLPPSPSHTLRRQNCVYNITKN